jgi:hypothetical protein
VTVIGPARLDSRQEALALFKFYQRRGYRISIRSIGRVLRELDIRFRDEDLFKWLTPLRKRSSKTYNLRTRRARVTSDCTKCRQPAVIVAQGENGELWCSPCLRLDYGGGPPSMFVDVPYGPGHPGKQVAAC